MLYLAAGCELIGLKAYTAGLRLRYRKTDFREGVSLPPITVVLLGFVTEKYKF